MEPWFNEPLFNEHLGITNNIFPDRQKLYCKIYGTEPRFNEPISAAQTWNLLKIYLDITKRSSDSSQAMNTVVCRRSQTF